MPDSEHKPHVFTTSAAHEDDDGASVFVFHRGQIWVRHGPADAEATPEDLRRLTYDAAGRLLERGGVGALPDAYRAPGQRVQAGEL